MEKQQLIDRSRALIAESNKGQAIDLIEDFLMRDKKYRRLYREALRLSALYTKTERAEVKGTISFDNAQLAYNQVTDRLLNLLDYIENDELDPDELKYSGMDWKQMYQSNKWFFLAGLPTLVLSILVVFLVIRDKLPGGGDDGLQNANDCRVSFAQSAFPKILLLPFYLPGAEEIRVEGLIIERLEDFSKEFNLQTDVELCRGERPGKLLNYDDADRMGRTHLAEMIIWGRAEKVLNGSIVKTRFKYLGEVDTLRLTNLKWQGEKQIDTIKVLSNIATQGELTDNIESTLALILGIAVDQSGDPQKAIATLEASNVTDSAGVLLKNALLADNYLKMEDKEKARIVYDKLLTVHPDYWLALNNRGVLLMQEGDFLGAISDFTKVLKKRPDDADMLLNRANAYKKSEQLQPARKDFEEFIEKNPERKDEAAPLLKETNAEIRQSQNVIERTGQKPVSHLTHTEVIRAVEAQKKLGDNEEASRLVAKGLQLTPLDPELIAQNIELTLRKGDRTAAEKIYRDALSRGVSKAEIARQSPQVSRFIEGLGGTRTIDTRQ